MPAAAAETAPAYSPDADARPLLSVRADAGDAAALASLATHGAVILEHALPDDAVAAAAAALAPFLAEVAERWDTEADALQIPWRKWGVTRCPRVNAGKKNVHFDPHGSPLHDALARLAAVGGFERLLSAHTGGRCTLAESGLSLTCAAGSGMEWHADGVGGEATVLMALDDVAADKGPLGIVPGSHAAYSTRKAASGMMQRGCCAAADAGACDGDAAEAEEEEEEEEEDQVAAVMAQCAPPVWYAYRRGAPALLDARTLHAAADNVSGRLRAVVWLIYTQDAAQGEQAEAEERSVDADARAASDALAALSVQ